MTTGGTSRGLQHEWSVNNVLLDVNVGRTERSEFRHYAKKPELTMFGPAYETRSLNSRMIKHSPESNTATTESAAARGETICRRE